MWPRNTWSSQPPSSNSPIPRSASPSNVPNRNYAPSPLGRYPNQPGPGSRPPLQRGPSTFSNGQQGGQTIVGYRRAVSLPPPPGVRDPVGVLEGILGVPLRGVDTPRGTPRGTPKGTPVGTPTREKSEAAGGLGGAFNAALPPLPEDEMAGDMGNGVGSSGEGDEDDEWMPVLEDGERVDFDGLSLEEWVEKLSTEKKERSYREVGVEEYEREKGKFQDLHRSIKACDEVLLSVESYLSAFQTDLGTVSLEIESLQNRSMTLDKQLENRKAVEKVLGPLVDDIVIPPNDVRRLVEGEVNDAWVKALHETDRRMRIIKEKDPEKIQAVREVLPELEKITHKIIERIRDFFISRIKALRLPLANSQQIQSAGFLSHRNLFTFLQQAHPQVAEEICAAYTNTMRWYYTTHFTRYHTSLSKLKLHACDPTLSLLGAEELSKSTTSYLPSLTTSLSSKPVAHADFFSLGRRLELLRNRTAPILTASQADSDQTAHYAEYPFRHFNCAILENAASEYSFLSDFFSHKTPEQLSNLFLSIFTPALSLGSTLTTTLTSTSHDILGLLLMVRLNQYNLYESQRRLIPVLENYLNATNMLLWPRFQKVVDAHCDSIKKLRDNSRAMQNLVKGQGGGMVLTQRFAGVLQGLAALSAEGEEETVVRAGQRVRGEWELWLAKLVEGAPGGAQKAGGMARNHRALVGAVIGDTEGKMARELREYFERRRGSVGV